MVGRTIAYYSDHQQGVRSVDHVLMNHKCNKCRRREPQLIQYVRRDSLVKRLHKQFMYSLGGTIFSLSLAIFLLSTITIRELSTVFSPYQDYLSVTGIMGAAIMVASMTIPESTKPIPPSPVTFGNPVSCNLCGTLNPPLTGFCTRCGCDLASTKPKPKRKCRPRARPDAHPNRTPHFRKTAGA
jgi:hypothetical protein